MMPPSTLLAGSGIKAIHCTQARDTVAPWSFTSAIVKPRPVTSTAQLDTALPPYWAEVSTTGVWENGVAKVTFCPWPSSPTQLCVGKCVIMNFGGVIVERFDLGQYAEKLSRYFASIEDVILAYLFGSHARGRAWAESDVDVAVLLAGRPDDDHCLDTRMEVIGRLMDLLRTDDVDVVILNQAPPALRYAVLRDGILLYCRDHRAKMEFHLYTLNEYLDFQPILRRHERAFLDKARRGEL